MATCNANQLLEQAAANGFISVDEGALELILTQLTCDLTGGGSASGGLSDYYAQAGPPVGTPGANNLLNIIVDVNGRQWMYFQGGWN